MKVKDVKLDLDCILNSISDDERVLVRRKDALIRASLIPISFFTLFLIFSIFYFIRIVGQVDQTSWNVHDYMKAFTIVFSDWTWYALVPWFVLSLVFVLLNYVNALVLYSIPEPVRSNSAIITSIVGGVKKIVSIIFLLCILSCAFFVYAGSSYFIILLPCSIFLCLMFINTFVSIEFFRYGLAPVIKKVMRVK